MRILSSAIAITAFALGLPLAASADEAIDSAVKARQGYFQMLAINMGTLSGMAKGDIAYDEAAASLAAANIEALSKYDLPALFVEGSASGQVQNTGAKAEIWTDMDGFKGKFNGLVEAAAGSADAVKGGQANIGPVLGKLGGSCKACHDSFREKS